MSEGPENLIEKIKRYVPGIRADNSQHGIERLIILLLGFAGHGKSSLINSCMCVMKNEIYRNLAGAGADEGGRTTKRTSHSLTNTIWITDNRGFKKMEPGEILEVCAQQRNLRLEGDVEWERDNLQETIRCIPEVNKRSKEFILPVIVHSCLYEFKGAEGAEGAKGAEGAEGAKGAEGAEENSMRKLVKKCQEITGIPPIVVITNVGLPNTRSKDDPKISSKFGEMGCTNRICLENYTANSQMRSQEADDQFLKFLEVCMNEAEYGIQQRGGRDPFDIFAKNVAEQIKEEKEEKEENYRQVKKELEERLRKEEAKMKCSIL